eukprot:RCo012631
MQQFSFGKMPCHDRDSPGYTECSRTGHLTSHFQRQVSGRTPALLLEQQFANVYMNLEKSVSIKGLLETGSYLFVTGDQDTVESGFTSLSFDSQECLLATSFCCPTGTASLLRFFNFARHLRRSGRCCEVLQIPTKKFGITKVDWNPLNADQVACSFRGFNELHCFDVESETAALGRPQVVLECPCLSVYDISWAEPSSCLKGCLLGGADGSLCLWDPRGSCSAPVRTFALP